MEGKGTQDFEPHFKDQGLAVPETQPGIVNTLYSWIAVSEQAATGYPVCVNFCCFGPVTIHSSILISSK